MARVRLYEKRPGFSLPIMVSQIHDIGPTQGRFQYRNKYSFLLQEFYDDMPTVSPTLAA